MLYISAYYSLRLDDNSHYRFGESCIAHIAVSDTENDNSNALNEHIHLCGEGRTQPTWDKLSLCLRTDWRRLKCWPIKEGSKIKEPLQKAFESGFDRPLIAGTVLQRLQIYADYFHDCQISVSEQIAYGQNLFCFNKDESFTLEWAFASVDQGNDDAGLQKFRKALIVGSIDQIIDDVIWDFYH